MLKHYIFLPSLELPSSFSYWMSQLRSESTLASRSTAGDWRTQPSRCHNTRIMGSQNVLLYTCTYVWFSLCKNSQHCGICRLTSDVCVSSQWPSHCPAWSCLVCRLGGGGHLLNCSIFAPDKFDYLLDGLEGLPVDLQLIAIHWMRNF